MANLLTNIAQTCADLTNIKNAIQDKGVDIASGTPSSEYSSKIDEVYEAGKQELLELHPEVTVGGNYISVDDVSELPHSVACKVESVNLWTGKSEYTIVGNGKVQNLYQRFITYSHSMSFSCEVTSENPEYSATGNLVYLLVNYTDGTGDIFTLCNNNTTGNIKRQYQFNTNGTKVIEIVSVMAHNRFTGGTVTLSNIMLNFGTTALPYTPYVDNPETVQVTRCGRNLLNPNALGSGTIVEYNGVPCYKYTDKNKDTGNWTIAGCFKENTQYTITVKQYRKENAPVAPDWQFVIKYTDGSVLYSGKIPSGESQALVSKAGKTVESIFSPSYGWDTLYLDLSVSCLNEGATALPYEPYNGQTLISKEDGTVEGMTSVSPYMNIFTDTEGANLDVTYRKSLGVQTEYDRFWDEFQKSSGECQFAGNGWNNKTFKPKNDLNPTYPYMLFRRSGITGDLVEILNQLGIKLNLSNSSSLIYAFNYTKFTRLGEIDMSNLKGNDSGLVTETFGNSTLLHTIDKIKVHEGIKFTSSTFGGTPALENITFEGIIGTTINFGSSPLTRASITNVVEHLSSTATGQTATFKKTAKEAAFTQEEWEALIATKSNWTFSLV